MPYAPKALFFVLISLTLFGGGYWLATNGVFTWRESTRPIASVTSTPKTGLSGADGPVALPETRTDQSTTTNEGIMNATLHTNKGDITIEFSPLAPHTVENFIKLAQSHFYDGVKFHRVIAGFMIQGGDPLSKDDAHPERWGTGGPGYTFKDELGPDNHNVSGTIAMANAGPDTNGSQFFINVADNTYLDSKHTVFGKVVAGVEVVKAIESVQTDQSDRPLDPVIIESITVR